MVSTSPRQIKHLGRSNGLVLARCVWCSTHIQHRLHLWLPTFEGARKLGLRGLAHPLARVHAVLLRGVEGEEDDVETGAVLDGVADDALKGRC